MRGTGRKPYGMWDSEQWAEVNAEGDRLMVELYPRRSGQPWTFDFDDVTAALLEAKRRLADLGSPNRTWSKDRI